MARRSVTAPSRPDYPMRVFYKASLCIVDKESSRHLLDLAAIMNGRVDALRSRSDCARRAPSPRPSPPVRGRR